MEGCCSLMSQVSVKRKDIHAIAVMLSYKIIVHVCVGEVLAVHHAP